MASEIGRPPSTARQRTLLPLIKEQGYVSVSEMAAKFGVSEMTIRRDLKALEVDGSLHRTHGGAVVSDEDPLGAEPPFLERQRTNAEGKRLIARAAMDFIRKHDTIGIDVGTTTLQLAKNLMRSRDVRVFTNSLRVALTLANSDVAVYTPGGQIRALEMSVTGNMAITALSNFRFDHVFLGVSGITSEGIFDYSIDDSEVKQAFIRQAKKVVVLADASKFGSNSAVLISGLQGISTIITDAVPQQELRDALETSGVQLVVCQQPPS